MRTIHYNDINGAIDTDVTLIRFNGNQCLTRPEILDRMYDIFSLYNTYNEHIGALRYKDDYWNLHLYNYNIDGTDYIYQTPYLNKVLGWINSLYDVKDIRSLNDHITLEDVGHGTRDQWDIFVRGRYVGDALKHSDRHYVRIRYKRDIVALGFDRVVHHLNRLYR